MTAESERPPTGEPPTPTAPVPAAPAARPLKVALAVAGAASLGAFEAGAVAALVTGLRPLCTGDDPAVRLDIVTGSSSGAIIGTLAAHCLTAGVDAVDVLREAWLDHASLETLRGRGLGAPLSLDRLRAAMDDLVDPARWPRTQPRDGIGPIRVAMSMVSLRGQLAPGAPAPGYLRWAVHEVDGSSTAVLVDALDHALASSANSLAFGPRLAGRTPADAVDPAATPLDVTDGGWFTDGGTLDDEPVARALAMAGDDDPDTSRLLVLVHPFSLAEPTGPGWRDPAVPPTWSATLLRCIEVQRGQRLALDLREVERSNEQVRALRSRCADDEAFEELRVALGIGQRRCVGLDIVSPTTGDLGRGVTAAGRLSGDLLANLGGFASRTLRVSDFDLGYRCTLAWFDQQARRADEAAATAAGGQDGRDGGDRGDGRYRGAGRAPGAPAPIGSASEAAAVLGADAWRAAGQAAFTRYLPGRGHLRTGAATLRSLAPGEQLAVARLGARMTGVLAHDAWRARDRAQEPVAERREAVPPGALRHSRRWIHGDGLTLAATFEPTGAVPGVVHLLPEPTDALVRLSITMPGPRRTNWLGLGVRLQGDDPIDLTMASSSPARILRHVPLPSSPTIGDTFVSSAVTYRVGDERLVVGARLPDLPASFTLDDLRAVDPGRRTELGEALAGTTVELRVARPCGRWYRWGTLTLRPLVDEAELDPPLRFAPSRGARRSSGPARRDRWYAASQRGQRPPWLVRTIVGRSAEG